MTEREMLERIENLERHLLALQSAVVAISLGGAIKVNNEGIVESVSNPKTSNPLVYLAGTAWTPR